jgi:hypothetical protein
MKRRLDGKLLATTIIFYFQENIPFTKLIRARAFLIIVAGPESVTEETNETSEPLSPKRPVYCTISRRGRRDVLYNITSRTLFHPAACRPASVLCSSDFVRVELRYTITVIGLRRRVALCGRVSTSILVPPTGRARHL